ncbi:FliM/FliN family flagellar motor switch protein [Shewanella sp. A25]|nr:FliM/FliN family flagellar motor switch protein [Shewanella shenzhenensis]
MNRRSLRKKLITGEAAAALPVYLLTRDEHNQHHAIEVLDRRLVEMQDSMFYELNQLINGLEFEISLERIEHQEISAWLNQGERLMMGCEIPAIEDSAYMAMEFLASHQLADLCLGGRISPNMQAKGELTMSERRIAQRVFLRLSRGLESVLSKSNSAMTPDVIKQTRAPNRYTMVGYRVGMQLEKELITWYLWLPVALVTSNTEALPIQGEAKLLLNDAIWQGLPVVGRVVLAEKQVNIRQLQKLLQGQFLPLAINQDNATFRLGDKTLFCGKVAHEDGKLAFQII